MRGELPPLARVLAWKDTALKRPRHMNWLTLTSTASEQEASIQAAPHELQGRAALVRALRGRRLPAVTS